jgi:hypothetical protein
MGPANYYVQLFTVINKKLSTLVFNIHLFNFPLSTCWGRTMLHSAQPFIYICLYCGHSRWRSYYQEGDGLISNYQEGDGLRSHYQEGEWFEIPLSRGRMVWDPIIKRENGLRSNYQEGEWFEIQLSRERMVWDPIIKREMVWDPIKVFSTATFWCLSQARIWISSAICHGLYVFNDLRWEIVVGFVDISGVVDHHFKKNLQLYCYSWELNSGFTGDK